jgi:hypothetical protein
MDRSGIEIRAEGGYRSRKSIRRPIAKPARRDIRPAHEGSFEVYTLSHAVWERVGEVYEPG